MPVDVSSVVDLTLYDRTASDLVDIATRNYQALLPEADISEGTIEAALTEALALPVAEMMYAINRVPGATAEASLALAFQVTRSEGVAPTTTVQFTAGAAGASIPAGSLVQVDTGDDRVVFATDTEVTILAGTATGSSPATATVLTDDINGVPAGTGVTVISAVTGVTSALLTTPVVGGAGPEDTPAYLGRVLARTNRLTDTLTVGRHFEDYALESPNVTRARAVEGYNPAGGAIGSAPGHVTVAVLGPAGALLSAAAKTTLEQAMDAESQANLIVHVTDPVITQVPVTATVKAAPGFAPTDVQAAAVTALQAFLSPLTWQWGALVRRNELIALLENVPGVDYVQAGHPTAPAGDVTLAGAAPLASAGALTITVTT